MYLIRKNRTFFFQTKKSYPLKNKFVTVHLSVEKNRFKKSPFWLSMNWLPFRGRNGRSSPVTDPEPKVRNKNFEKRIKCLKNKSKNFGKRSKISKKKIENFSKKIGKFEKKTENFQKTKDRKKRPKISRIKDRIFQKKRSKISKEEGRKFRKKKIENFKKKIEHFKKKKSKISEKNSEERSKKSKFLKLIFDKISKTKL